MDIGLFIVVLIVMYVIPEIMKRLKPKKPYQYPEFPSTLPSDRQEPLGIPGGLSHGMKPPVFPSLTGEGMPGDEGDPAWGLHVAPALADMQGLSGEMGESRRVGLSEAALGVVWAEIISPPVALRPMRQGIRRF